MPAAMKPETKASIMAALLEGQAISKVAEEFKMNKGSVSRIKKELQNIRLQEVATKKETLQPNSQPSSNPEKRSLEELILEYVSTNLQTLKNQSEVFGRAEYIEKQSASEMAVLHGVIADKTLRIISAMESVTDSG